MPDSTALSGSDLAEQIDLLTAKIRTGEQMLEPLIGTDDPRFEPLYWRWRGWLAEYECAVNQLVAAGGAE